MAMESRRTGMTRVFPEQKLHVSLPHLSEDVKEEGCHLSWPSSVVDQLGDADELWLSENAAMHEAA